MTAHSTRRVETPGQKGRLVSGPLASDSAGHSSAAGPAVRLPPTASFLSSTVGRQVPLLAPRPAPPPTRPSSTPGPGWGRWGEVWWSSETPVAAAPLRAPRDLGEEEEGVQGAGSRERKTAGLSRRVVRGGGGRAGAPFQPPGSGDSGM